MSRRVVDLSLPLRDGEQGVSAALRADVPEYLGMKCYAYDLFIPSHTGTYFETASHLFRGGTDTGAFPLDRLLSPGVCLTVADGDRRISARVLDDALREATVPDLEGCSLLVHTELREIGSHAYFSRDAATWMRDHGVALMGSDTPRYDTGFEEPTGFFVELFEAGIPIIANITNLDLLPARGFTLVSLPLAVEGVCTAPCRVIALVDEQEERI